MRSRPLILVLFSALMAAGSPSAASTDGVASPGAEAIRLAVDTVLSRVAAAEIATPDPAALAGAGSVEAAIRAALPDAPPTPALPGAAPLDPAIPAPLRAPVARLLAGVEAAETLRASALPDDPAFIREAARAARFDGRIDRYAGRIDVDTLLRSTLLLAATIDRAVSDLVAGRTPARGACVGTPQPPPVDIEGQIAIDTAGTRTRYTKPYTLVIDLGGCDEYAAAVGGANGLAADPVSVLLDLGDDPDTYENGPDTFTLGGALAGTAASLDQGGDDVYRPTGLAALGAGVVGGVGLHVDVEGSDTYTFSGAGGGYGAEGLGTLGVGVMLDLEGGDDTYDFDFFSPAAPLTRLLSAQGVGLGGVGVLADGGGDDSYEVGSSGNLLIVEAQGVGDLQHAKGLLLDASGDDTYLASVDIDSGPDANGYGGVSGQGLGVQDGHGYLVDGGGDDRYGMLADVGGDVGAKAEVDGQGRGFGSLTRPGIGMLADVAGDDTYDASARAVATDPEATTASVLAQGEAFFFQGLGILLDQGGDDAYRLATEAEEIDELGQGAATAASTGLLVDADGNDTYAAGPRSQGYAETPYLNDIGDVHGAIGGLIDGGGRNSFTGPGSEDYSWVRGETSIGFGIDGGEAHSVALGLFDGLSPVGRPHPVPTIDITSPSGGFVLHGEAPVTGTSDGGPLAVDRVEHRIDGGRWTLATEGSRDWEAWSVPLSAEALTDGPHQLRARAWASRLDSALDFLTFEVERWIPLWRAPAREGDETIIGFDLRDRDLDLVEAPDVSLHVDGVEVPLEAGGGRYTGRVTLAEGEHEATITIPGQTIGSTAFTI